MRVWCSREDRTRRDRRVRSRRHLGRDGGTQPRRLLVLGAGAVGLELVQAFVRLGTEVDVVDIAPAFLPHEDPEIAKVMRNILESEGIRFHLGAKTLRVKRIDSGIELIVWDDAGERAVAC